MHLMYTIHACIVHRLLLKVNDLVSCYIIAYEFADQFINILMCRYQLYINSIVYVYISVLILASIIYHNNYTGIYINIIAVSNQPGISLIIGSLSANSTTIGLFSASSNNGKGFSQQAESTSIGLSPALTRLISVSSI